MVHPLVPVRSRVGRAGAALSLLSATLHAACDGTHCTTVWVIVLSALMSLGCIWCAWDLWTRPFPRAWAMTAPTREQLERWQKRDCVRCARMS